CELSKICVFVGILFEFGIFPLICAASKVTCLVQGNLDIKVMRTVIMSSVIMSSVIVILLCSSVHFIIH
ncbi:unnamed protein product, partial [Callosobruchus maculatus]